MVDEYDQPQEEDYSDAADMVRSMGSQGPQMPMDMVQVSRALGRGTFGHLYRRNDPEFTKQVIAYQRSTAARQAAASMQKPMSPDAQFYAEVGDLSGATVIQKTKGPSLFTLGEEYSFGGESYAVMPSGQMNAVDAKTGKPFRANVSQYAVQRGIKTVPFRGGDQQADLFRNTLSTTKTLMDNLNMLEDLYEKNNLYIGQLNPSETATKASQLESRILLDSMAILTGSRTLGGNVSNNDVNILQAMVPKAASTYFTNMKGNERARLRELKEFVISRLNSAAEANGIKMMKLNVGKDGSRGAPPGVTNQAR